MNKRRENAKTSGLTQGKIDGWPSALKLATPVLPQLVPRYFCAVIQASCILFLGCFSVRLSRLDGGAFTRMPG